MRRKKFFAVAVAGALTIAQMALPVMAAGGTIEVDVSTKTGVLRVEVPTTLSIAVNQFEIGDAGSQINSGTFTMTNKSEMPVKISVESTVSIDGELGGLVATKAAAAASTNAKGQAWLAVAAQTKAGTSLDEDRFDNAKTEDKVEKLSDLTEASPNVATFDATTKKVAQTFYLNAGTGDVQYGIITPDEDGDTQDVESFALFYELTEVDGRGITDNDTLRAAIKTAVDAGKVLYEVTSDLTGNTVDHAWGVNETDVTEATFSAGKVYYTAADEETAAKDLKGPEGEGMGATYTSYIYSEMENDGESAAFRYIGTLGDAKEAWTNSDITKISITYDIVGIKSSKYDEVKNDCVYGLYMKSNSATTVAGSSITNSSRSIIYTEGSDLATRLKSGNVVFRLNTDEYDVSELSVTKIVIDDVEYTSGGEKKFTSGDASEKADSDGKAYTLSGFEANSVTSVKVYYGDTYVVTYSFN